MNTDKSNNFVIKSIDSILVIGYILFEELIWNVFAKPVYQFFRSLAILDALTGTFQEMNRYLLLSVFIIIFVMAEAMGFFSGFCIVNGYLFLGLFVYALKIPVAAFTFWLFNLTKQQLMTFSWLKSAYEYIQSVIDKILNSDIHVYIKAKMIAVRDRIKQLSQKYFGEHGFIGSLKTHYLIYKTYIVNIYNTWTLFSSSKNRKSVSKQ